MRCLEPVGRVLRDYAHQNPQPELIAIAHYFFELFEIEPLRLGIVVNPGAVDTDDVELVFLSYRFQHLAAL